MTKIASESQDSPSHEGSSRDCVQRTDSALRSSIAKYGSNSVSSTPMLSLRNVEVRVRPIDSSAPSSATHVGIGGGSLSSLCCTAAQYYYAHAKSPEEKGAVKKIEGPGIVTGGPPTLLASSAAEPTQAPSARDAAADALDGRRISGAMTLKKYTWCDNRRAVKIYIHLEDIRPGEEADGPLLPEQVAVEFGTDRVAIAIQRASGVYLLAVLRTYGTILPQESSFSVTDKKVSVILKKEEESLTWFNLLKD